MIFGVIEELKQKTSSRRVLVIQDTTELNFSHHHKRGMGKLSNGKAKGLKVHSTMCISDEGVPLGIIQQKVWASQQSKKQKKSNWKVLIQEKESYRWIESVEITEKNLSSTQRCVVTMTDREGDIYELLTTNRVWGSELLIRGYHNRRVKKKKTDTKTESLWQVIRQTESGGQLKVQLDRASSHQRREATLTLRWTTLWIEPPKNKPNKEALEKRAIEVILAEEENPPTGEKPISWLLLSTIGIRNYEDVCVCVKWYSYRFLIERYHLVLKSGCGLEKLQLETADRIERAIATYAIVAWKLLWLTYEARVKGEQAAEIALEKYKWQSLYCVHHQTACPPQKIPTLKECMGWIAQLGGYIGRKGDREAGVKVTWRGWRRLEDIVVGWIWGLRYALGWREGFLC